ncbi:MAG: carbamoyltransferase N-terminal domain-containing protein, partial [Bacteroidia bacterium]
MKILGIHTDFINANEVNESSVSLLIDGKLVFCVAQERLSRIKVDGKFPADAIKDTLISNGLTINDIDHVATTCLHPTQTNKKYLASALSTFGDTGVFLGKKIKNFAWFYLYNSLKTPKNITVEVEKKKFDLMFNDHHRCHAAGAYYCSPFDEALVITLDGGGDGLDGSVYMGKDNQMELLMEIPHFQSPGTMYSAITNDLGFKRHRHEGKVTGLAAFGNPDIKRLGLENLLRYNTKKHRFISKEIAGHHKDLKGKSNYFYPLLQKFPKEDLAAVTQQIFENEVLAFISDAYETAKKKGHTFTKICLAGGCFANVKLNQRIFELGLFDNIYVYPAMGDDGLSAGAALLAYYKLNPNAPREVSKATDTYLGNKFSDEQIESALKEFHLAFNKVPDIETQTARLLAQGKVVARFNGRMEYGPRALGNRSVIASPFDKSINDWLNKKFNRTEFMPFAPSMTEEHASEYLENYNGQSAADYMTITYDIKKGMAEKMPAVVHVDNTARPQIVH